jgi:hypothetical protein
MKLFRKFSFGLMLVAAFASTGAHCGKVNPAVPIVMTVKTVDEGVAKFTDWAVKEEKNIALDAIKKCDGKMSEAFETCVKEDVAVHRAPIDKVKAAMKIYADALAIAQGVKNADVIAASKALIDAFASCGIGVGGI